MDKSKDSLKIKLTDLVVKSSYINDIDENYIDSIPKDVKYSVGGSIRIDTKEDSVVSIIKIDAIIDKKGNTKELYGIVTETYFQVNNIKNWIDPESEELKLPKDFATKLLNIGIGNTRGLLKGLLHGNSHYSECTLPIISVPVEMGDPVKE